MSSIWRNRHKTKTGLIEDYHKDTIARAWKSIIIASIIAFVGLFSIIMTAFLAPNIQVGSSVGFSIGAFLLGFGISLFAWFYSIRSDAKDTVKWCKEAPKHGHSCDKGDPFAPSFPAAPHGIFGPPPGV